MVFSSLAAFAVADRPFLLAVISLMAACLLIVGAALRMADLIQFYPGRLPQER